MQATPQPNETERWAIPADIADIEIPQAYIHTDDEGFLTDLFGKRFTVAKARKHFFGILSIEALVTQMAASRPPDFDFEKNFSANILAKYKKSWGEEDNAGERP